MRRHSAQIANPFSLFRDFEHFWPENEVTTKHESNDDTNVTCKCTEQTSIQQVESDETSHHIWTRWKIIRRGGLVLPTGLPNRLASENLTMLMRRLTSSLSYPFLRSPLYQPQNQHSRPHPYGQADRV